MIDVAGEDGGVGSGVCWLGDEAGGSASDVDDLARFIPSYGDFCASQEVAYDVSAVDQSELLSCDGSVQFVAAPVDQDGMAMSASWSSSSFWVLTDQEGAASALSSPQALDQGFSMMNA